MNYNNIQRHKYGGIYLCKITNQKGTVQMQEAREGDTSTQRNGGASRKTSQMQNGYLMFIRKP